MELFVVRANASGCFAGVRINQPKIRFAVKTFMQLLNRRRVASGDGAIGANKEQYHNSSLGRLEGIDGFAVQILRPCALHRLQNAWLRANDTRQKYNAHNFAHRYLREVHGGGKAPCKQLNSTRFALSLSFSARRRMLQSTSENQCQRYGASKVQYRASFVCIRINQQVKDFRRQARGWSMKKEFAVVCTLVLVSLPRFPKPPPLTPESVELARQRRRKSAAAALHKTTRRSGNSACRTAQENPGHRSPARRGTDSTRHYDRRIAP